MDALEWGNSNAGGAGQDFADNNSSPVDVEPLTPQQSELPPQRLCNFIYRASQIFFGVI